MAKKCDACGSIMGFLEKGKPLFQNDSKISILSLCSLIQKIGNDDPYPIIVVFESSFHFCIIVLQKAEPFA